MLEKRKVLDVHEARNTQQDIIDTATVLMMHSGYNAFSYADIAEQIGIRKASIHYHFPGKSDLARSVVERYRTDARLGVEMVIDTTPSPLKQLERYISFYDQEFQGRPRMCLCALLAAEMLTLPEDVRAEVQLFYHEQESLLARILQAGRAAGELYFAEPPELAAQLLLAALEGAMLAARAYGSIDRLRMLNQSIVQRYRAA